MKKFISVFILVFVIYAHFGCRSSNISRPDPEPSVQLEIDYNNIRDLETGLNWTTYNDNPTSMFRYIMEEQKGNRRLPNYDELSDFFEKMVIAAKNDEEGIQELEWIQESGYYISSSEFLTPENKKLYMGIKWDASSKTQVREDLAGGDLVNILLVQ